MQTFIHYFLHFGAPLFFVLYYYKKEWIKYYLIFAASMLVDLDHLLAWPDVFVPKRCSINFHPLHTYYAMIVYTIMLFPKKTRVWGIALLFHMLTDYIDCSLM